MTLHEIRRTHDYDENCFGCRASKVSFNLSAEFRAVESKERILRKDLDAYKRLVSEGLQPESHVGAAELEKRATHRLDIEGDNSHIPLMTDSQKDLYVEASKTITPSVAP